MSWDRRFWAGCLPWASIIRWCESSVFYSKQRHKTVLPKYLLLVLVSGAVSYAGIRLLSAKLGINPVSAKLMVETVLFFANFAVQRMFIFKPQAGAGGRGRRSGPRPH